MKHKIKVILPNYIYLFTGVIDFVETYLIPSLCNNLENLVNYNDCINNNKVSFKKRENIFIILDKIIKIDDTLAFPILNSNKISSFIKNNSHIYLENEELLESIIKLLKKLFSVINSEPLKLNTLINQFQIFIYFGFELIKQFYKKPPQDVHIELELCKFISKSTQNNSLLEFWLKIILNNEESLIFFNKIFSFFYNNKKSFYALQIISNLVIEFEINHFNIFISEKFINGLFYYSKQNEHDKDKIPIYFLLSNLTINKQFTIFLQTKSSLISYLRVDLIKGDNDLKKEIILIFGNMISNLEKGLMEVLAKNAILELFIANLKTENLSNSQIILETINVLLYQIFNFQENFEVEDIEYIESVFGSSNFVNKIEQIEQMLLEDLCLNSHINSKKNKIIVSIDENVSLLKQNLENLQNK